MQAESGLSMFAFARAAEVSYSTLLSWVRRAERSAASSRIVPVEIAVHAPVPLAPHLELSIGDVVVRVGPDFDESFLTRVVRVLRAC
jgi:hypothetical protein